MEKVHYKYLLIFAIKSLIENQVQICAALFLSEVLFSTILDFFCTHCSGQRCKKAMSCSMAYLPSGQIGKSLLPYHLAESLWLPIYIPDSISCLATHPVVLSLTWLLSCYFSVHISRELHQQVKKETDGLARQQVGSRVDTPHPCDYSQISPCGHPSIKNSC